MSIWSWLLDPSGLTPHGFCLSWAPGLIELHAASDAIVGLSYFSIPLALGAFITRRRDLQYGWIAYLFMAFILACGTTHLFSVLTLWVPAYGFEGLIKLLTAILSVATAFVLWPLLPKLVALPSPAQLQRVNGELSMILAEQAKTAALLRVSDARVRSANAELERKVAAQTAELRATNAQLSQALAERSAGLRAMAQQERQFRASFEAAAVGKAQVDPLSNSLLRVNPAFAEMLGHEPDDMAGKPLRAFTWPEDRASEEAEYARLLGGEIPAYVREQRYLRRDGEAIWGRISATLVASAETDEPALVVAVIENIDARHRAQLALQTTMTELELVVEQRTAALEQRDILLKEVYHRVKNNLQIVDGLLVMQARVFSDMEAKDAVRALRSRVHALGLVHHQLMHSKNLKTFDIEPFLQELSDNLLGAASDGVKITVRAIPLEAGLDFAIPLGLLVTELVTNSLKHAFPTGTGHIFVGLDHGPDGSVILVVSDDGKGQPPEGHQEKHGLGADIITGLAAQMRGTIMVTNDNGSRTEIRIPAPVF